MYYNQNTLLFLDGKWLSANKTQSTLQHPVLSHSNGIFEDLRSYQTENGLSVFKAIEHYKRLLLAAKKMYISLPYSPDQLLQFTYQLLQKNNLGNAYIQALAYVDKNNKPHLLLSAQEWELSNEPQGINLSILSHRQAFPTGINLIGHHTSSTLAKQQARYQGFDDALLLDDYGCISPSTTTFFYELDNVLYTTPSTNKFSSIARSTILELCQQLEIDCIEQELMPHEIKGADGAFRISTANGLENITSLDGIPFQLDWEDTLGYQLFRAYQRTVLEITPLCFL